MNQLSNEQTPVEVNTEVDFDLGDYIQPSTQHASTAKPRIHLAPGESVCISCEG